MGTMRILKKSFIMATRSRKRFISAIFLYCALSWWVAFSLERGEVILATMGVVGGLIIATVYGYILSQFRRIQIATLKCIGWDNVSIQVLMIGEILLVSLLGYVLTLEIDIHLLGIASYLPFTGFEGFIFSGLSLALSLLVVIVAQIPAIIVAYRKTLKVRPMVALKA
ncbi:MAG: hypothetical protein ACTSSJ_00235 [Candidatus Odinarchaeia archaeon]